MNKLLCRTLPNSTAEYTSCGAEHYLTRHQLISTSIIFTANGKLIKY